MRGKITSTIKSLAWGGAKKKAGAALEIMSEYLKEGGLGIRDPVNATDKRKITVIKKIISKDRKPWMWHAERNLTMIVTE